MLDSVNCQKSRLKVYVDEKSTFLKEACHLKGEKDSKFQSGIPIKFIHIKKHAACK